MAGKWSLVDEICFRSSAAGGVTLAHSQLSARSGPHVEATDDHPDHLTLPDTHKSFRTDDRFTLPSALCRFGAMCGSDGRLRRDAGCSSRRGR
jgi:hypothetical protein